MPFFDFHCHPAFKHLMSADTSLTPWHPIKVKLKVGKLFGREISIGINQLFNGSFNSQSNLNQMQKGRVNLAGVVLYSLENKIAKGILERKIANSGKINMLDPVILQQLELGTDYYASTKRTMDSLRSNPTPPDSVRTAAGANFKFINSVADYDPTDTKTVHGILILEGLHNFCSDPFSANAAADFDANFEDFKNRYHTRIFAVNIPHLQDFPYANHAFGMQFINESLFYPSRSGFNDWGKQLVKKMYDNNILIDVKHMSLFTRTQLQAIKSQVGYQDMPLICTHAGLTGCHSNDRYKYLSTRPKNENGVWRLRHYKTYGTVPDSAFNLSSINLYDDDILAILHSKGLIGISLDQRILGFPTESVAYQINDSPYDQEYIGPAEAAFFFRGLNEPGDAVPYTPNDDVLTGDEAMTHGEMSFEYHYYYFLNQVFHILKVASNAGIPVREAAGRICIGSDFDGLINSLDCCTSAEQYAGFKDGLREILANTPRFWRNSPIRKSEIDIDELLDGIFFSNAYRFLQVNFT